MFDREVEEVLALERQAFGQLRERLPQLLEDEEMEEGRQEEMSEEDMQMDTHALSESEDAHTFLFSHKHKRLLRSLFLSLYIYIFCILIRRGTDSISIRRASSV